MDSENIVIKSRKIRFYPTKEQRDILCNWFGCARYVYNKTVEYLKAPDTKATWFDVKSVILNSLPDWASSTPYQIKSIAVRDACDAVKAAKKKYIKTGKISQVKFRSRKQRKENIFIPKSAVKEDSFYRKTLGVLNLTERIGDAEYDCRVIFDRGRFFICKPESVQILKPENQRFKLVALDPGVRTFQTFYSPELCGKIGSKDFNKIYRLCYTLDALQAKMSKAKCKQKRRMRKAAERIRWKIQDLISELHHKASLFLCRTFDTIILPPFETSQMVTKLRSKVARSMLTWAHYKFATILHHKARQYGCSVIRQNEAYTSKTCSSCGAIQQIGSKEIYKCKNCSSIVDRDVNGARGIFLRALVDSPLLESFKYAFVNKP